MAALYWLGIHKVANAAGDRSAAEPPADGAGDVRLRGMPGHPKVPVKTTIVMRAKRRRATAAPRRSDETGD